MNDKIKISQLELEENINEESLIPIVQDNKTKAIKSKDLLKDLDGRIDSINSQLDTNVRELDIKKASKKEVDSKIWTMANMGQDVKEAMTGGSVAVVGKDSVLESNIVDKQVTRRKINCYRLSEDGNLLSKEMNIYYYGFMYSNTGGKIYGDFPTVKLTLEDIDFINIPLKFNFTSHITFWDETDTFISGYIQGSLDNGINTSELKNIPDNANYVLFGTYQNRLGDGVLAKTSKYAKDLKPVYLDDSLLITKENLDTDIKFKKETIEDLTLYPYGNLLDKEKVLKNMYYNTSGQLVNSNGNDTFETEINPTESYTFNFTSHITFWDKDKRFISGYVQGSLDNGINTEKLKNIPSNAKYVRMLIYHSRLENSVFALTNYYSLNLKCVYYIPNIITENENLNNTQNKNPLYHKKALFFGDSWCAGNTSSPGGWTSIIKSNNPTMSITNCGKHGADWSQCYTNWIANKENWQSLDDDYDYVIIESYTNGLYTTVDKLSKNLGNIDEFTYYNSDNEIISALGNTYAKDMELCIFNITKRWQGKKIGLMFPYKSVDMLKENNAFRVFREQVFKCCRKYNISVFDNFDGCNIQSYRQEFVEKYFFEQDGVHLNNLGYEIITPPIENWMKTL